MDTTGTQQSLNTTDAAVSTKVAGPSPSTLTGVTTPDSSKQVVQVMLDAKNVGQGRTIQLCFNRGDDPPAVIEWNDVEGFVFRASPGGPPLFSVPPQGKFFTEHD